jgi:hypothetical protein
LAKVRTTWGKASDRLRQRANKHKNTVSDVFRRRSGTGKSYCRTRFDVESERVNTCNRATALTIMRVVKDLYILQKSQSPNITPHARNSALHLSLSSYPISTT